MGAYDQAIAAAQRALALAMASGDVVLHALANQYLGLAYQHQGDYRRAIDCFKQTMAVPRRGAPPRALRAGLLARRALPCLSSPGAMPSWGRSPRAVPSGKKGSGLPRRLLTPLASWMPRVGSVCWPSAKATCPGHSPCSNEPWASVRTRTSQLYFPLVAAALGAAYTLGGRVADAVPLLTQAMEQAYGNGKSGLPGALSSLLWGRRRCWLAAWRRRTLSPSARWHSPVSTREHGYQAYALHLLGEIAAHRDPPDAALAEAHYQQALALADELGMRPLQAHCHLGLGMLYAKIEQREQARAELSTAIALYRTMEMTFWLPQAEAALAQVEAR